MSWHRSSRTYHKWLMLFVGLQFVIWSISGAYMVLLDIDYIHGDSLVIKHQAPLNSEQINYPIAQLYTDHPDAENLVLTTLLGNAVYRFSEGKAKYLLSADTGKLLSPINEAHARQIAKHKYANSNAKVTQVSMVIDNPPRELNARHLPVWRVDFDDFASPSFYISVESGELVTKRHSFWRLFDWMFSFHVMDYIEEDASNKLLLIVTLSGLIASLFGFVLTYFRVFRAKKNRQNKTRRVI